MKNLVEELFSDLKEKEELIIKRRFGLLGDEPESLESIGKNLGITRERVRQIQNNALEKLKKLINENKEIDEFIEKLKELLEPLGVKEERSFYKLIIEKKIIRNDELNHLKFILLFHKKIHYYHEEEELKSFYAKDEAWANFLKHVLKKINIYFLENHQRVFEEREIFEIIARELKIHLPHLEANHFYEILRIFKYLYKNPFGKWGFVSNPLIVPQSLKSKILTILEIEGKPLHFSEIYNKLLEISKIEDEFLHPNWKRRYYSLESIKNELIKNENFVLVGRGTYALKKWGFKGGTTFELLKEFLISKKEISLEEILEFLKKQRILKLTTLNIYLYRLQKEGLIKIEKNKIIVLKDG